MRPRSDQKLPVKPEQEKITVLLVDDHTSIRQMLAFIIPREGPYQIVAQASSGLEAIECCRQLQPQVVILDLLLPEMTGVEVVRHLRSASKDTRMLVYSGTTSGDLIAEVMDAQPHGFVHKEDSLQVFREALNAVAQGRRYFAKAVETMVKSDDHQLSILTERERSVLQLLARGQSNKLIADQLNMAVKTVETHRSHLCQKLGIFDVASLTRFAVRHGLVALG